MRHDISTKLKTFGTLRRIYDKLECCMLGLRTPEGLHKKLWMARSKTKGAFLPLEKNIFDRSHHHVPSLGGSLVKRTGLYTAEMFRAVAKCIMKRQEPEHAMFAVSTNKIDRESLQTLTFQQVERLTVTVMKLHRRCGHPRDRALLKTLAARNADGKTLAIAEQLK